MSIQQIELNLDVIKMPFDAARFVGVTDCAMDDYDDARVPEVTKLRSLRKQA